jgi:translation initiation factor 2 alpha subunit (eIF-2alpha)
MFFYHSHIPDINSIVIAVLQPEKENENCFYVKLPEFNNIEGIINKKEFSRKIKRRNKSFSLLRKEKMFPCIISSNNDEFIELSIRDVDEKHKKTIVTRFLNVNKILKLFKFISVEYKLDYYDTVDELYSNIITQLYDEDLREEKIDDYSNTYTDFLLNKHKITELINVDEKLQDNISNKLNTLIKEGISSSTLNFDISVWKAEKDAIFVMRDLFTEIKRRQSNIDIRYIGAPTYQITLKSKISDMDATYTGTYNMIQEWMEYNNVSGYGIKFDVTNKEIKMGEVSISYPYKVIME